MQYNTITEEHLLFRNALKAFLKAEVEPNIDQWETQREVPGDLWKKMGEMGFLGLNFPEKWGGSALDFWYAVIFAEEVSKMWSAGFAANFLVSQFMSSTYILHHGSQVLQEKYLPKTISGHYIASVGITEPGAGSDVAAIQTKATRVDDHWIVNGAKTFITNGYLAKYMVTACKTDAQNPASMSLIVIDLESEGVTRTKLDKMGWHASDTSEIGLNQVKVPIENLVGAEGKGFYYLMQGLQLERIIGAIMSYAACEKTMEYTLQYMKEREAFGKSISKIQVLRHRMAQLHAEVYSLKPFLYDTCNKQAQGISAVKEASMAKLLASELSEKVVHQCLQMFGGYGYMEEYKIARAYRDARVGTILAGSSEIMREIIAKMYIDEVNY
ncbi:MAG: acyl-CoA dehydrogenase family protein [Chitinophagales bacterium]|jgi:alkylation response protein AidB-like acyl-CoA dehydrogenase|nr:acyl-CoA dehydrogenase family protein [Chitinophagales bacterium]